MVEEMFPDEYIDDWHVEEIPSDENNHKKADIDYGIKKLKLYQARHRKLEDEKKSSEYRIEEVDPTKPVSNAAASCRKEKEQRVKAFYADDHDSGPAPLSN